MVSVKFIRDRARKILKEFDVTEPPIPVRQLIEGFALRIEQVDREDGYDGELIPELRSIRINKAKPKTRQRFTLAHELGHWVLYHRERLLEEEVTSGTFETAIVNEDDSDSERWGTSAEDGQENTFFNSSSPRKERDREANIFAAELLMPTRWVKADWKKFESNVDRLAERYKVSDDAMWIKVIELGLIK